MRFHIHRWKAKGFGYPRRQGELMNLNSGVEAYVYLGCCKCQEEKSKQVSSYEAAKRIYEMDSE